MIRVRFVWGVFFFFSGLSLNAAPVEKGVYIADASDGTLLKGCLVVCSRSGKTVRTGRWGYAKIAFMPGGKFHVSREGYVPVVLSAAGFRIVYLKRKNKFPGIFNWINETDGLCFPDLLPRAVIPPGNRIRYPDLARKKGLAKTVVIGLYILRSGRVRNAKLVQRPGYGFEAAALDGVKGVRFFPASLKGQSVASYFALPVTFRIR